MFKNHLPLLICWFAISLGGCASAPPPKRIDPLTDLMPRSSVVQSKNTQLRDSKSKTLGLIISTGTSYTVEHLKQQTENAKVGFGNATMSQSDRDATVQDLDPKLLVTSVVEMLRRKLKSVQLLNDFTDIGASKVDAFAVVDIYLSDDTSIGNSTELEIIIILFDKDRKLIGEVRASAKRNYWINWASENEMPILELSRKAVIALDAEVQKIVR